VILGVLVLVEVVLSPYVIAVEEITLTKFFAVALLFRTLSKAYLEESVH
jgi:hypothetical protein